MPKGPWLILEIVAFCIFVFIPAVILANYSGLPAKVPTHFNLAGTPDAFGDKSTLILLLILSVSIYALLTAVPFNPSLINVPGPRTPENIASAISLTRFVKVEVVTFKAFLVWRIIETAYGRANGLGPAPLLFVASILVTAGVGLYKSSRHAQ